MARIGKNINRKVERRRQEMLANRKPIVDQCKGEELINCKDITNGLCNCYIDPSSLWRHGSCPRASHLEVELLKKSSEKIRVGQQKQKHIKVKK